MPTRIGPGSTSGRPGIDPRLLRIDPGSSRDRTWVGPRSVVDPQSASDSPFTASPVDPGQTRSGRPPGDRSGSIRDRAAIDRLPIVRVRSGLIMDRRSGSTLRIEPVSTELWSIRRRSLIDHKRQAIGGRSGADAGLIHARSGILPGSPPSRRPTRGRQGLDPDRYGIGPNSMRIDQGSIRLVLGRSGTNLGSASSRWPISDRAEIDDGSNRDRVGVDPDRPGIDPDPSGIDQQSLLHPGS